MSGVLALIHLAGIQFVLEFEADINSLYAVFFALIFVYLGFAIWRWIKRGV
jgi:hypothetical protein